MVRLRLTGAGRGWSLALPRRIRPVASGLALAFVAAGLTACASDKIASSIRVTPAKTKIAKKKQPQPPAVVQTAAVAPTAAVASTGAIAPVLAPSQLDEAKLAALKEKYRRPATPPPTPASNPLTPASVELGRHLFVDANLSMNRTKSCQSCHLPNAAWADHHAKPVADNGVPMSRRSQTLLDVAWQEVLLWDGRTDSLEKLVPGPLSSPLIMGLPMEQAVQRVSDNPEYKQMFAKAYPGDGIKPDTLSAALSSYMRTIQSPRTRFDHWVDGDDKALTANETRGFVLFNGKANCATCHSGWRFTDEGFRDIGLRDTADPGRGKLLAGIESMTYAFKTPTLRGSSERAPYMHDGSLPTLESVVDHYDQGGIKRPSLSTDMYPLHLSQDEKQDLIAFLKTLSPGAAAPDATIAATTRD